jgi:hypothetical protein
MNRRSFLRNTITAIGGIAPGMDALAADSRSKSEAVES